MSNAEIRTWRSNKGSEIEANFIRFSGTRTVFENSQGTCFEIQFDALSDADQAHLRDRWDKYQASRGIDVYGQYHWTKSAKQLAEERAISNGDPLPPLNSSKPSPVVTRNVRPARHLPANVVADHNLLQNVNPQQFGGGGGRAVPRFQDADALHVREPLTSTRPSYSVSDNADKWAEQHREQQAEMDRHREIQDLRSRAFHLESKIRHADRSSSSSYRSMSLEADRLSQDASRLGNHGAAFNFSNASSSLRNEENDRNSFTRPSSLSTGMDSDANRRGAASSVFFGGASIDSF